MTTDVYIAIYAGVLIFLAGCIRRIVLYARTPLHLRWELYPVPHEDPLRAKHGGSYFESAEWWKAPQVVHRTGEWAAMFQEIAFLKSLRESNPRLWAPSFLFHGGLYLSACSVFLIASSTLAGVVVPACQAARGWPALLTAVAWVGIAGEVLVLAGAALLLLRRMTDAELRNYTKPGDIFNLLFFLAAFGFLAAGAWFHGSPSASMNEIARGILRFDRGLKIATPLAAGLILASALIAWIPFTHMAHFIAKYFTWHSVRWDDRRSERGSALEAKAAEAMNYRPTWAARHMGADGELSWGELAATDPVREVRK